MRFSVIIPVRDGAATIERAVTSCLTQDWDDLEVIVVDNGSRDRSAELVMALRDPRVRLIRLARPGRSAARNVGLNEASGDIVVFLDADDELCPDKLSRSARILANGGADAVQGATLLIDDEGGFTSVYPYQRADFYPRLLVRNSIPINSMVVRRDVCSRFPEGVEYCEDWHFWLATLKGRRISVHRHPDSIVHIRGDSTSADVATMRAFELPIFIQFKTGDLSLRWTVLRALRCLRAATDYATIEPIDYVETALQKSRLHRLTMALRIHPTLRRVFDMVLKLPTRGAR